MDRPSLSRISASLLILHLYTRFEMASKDKLTEQELVSHQSLVFNLTGGTKAMSLAAYHVAQQRSASIVYMESEEKHNQVFRYEWKQQQLQFKDSKMLPECVQLKDFFNVQLGSRKWTLKKPSGQRMRRS